MDLQLDLHAHTQVSRDGSVSLNELLRTANERGVTHIAVTDHDRLGHNGTRGTLDRNTGLVTTDFGVQLIRGIEISCVEESTGRLVHMLGYLPADADVDVLTDYCERFRQQEEEWFEKCVAELSKTYGEISVEDYCTCRDGEQENDPWFLRTYLCQRLLWPEEQFYMQIYPIGDDGTTIAPMVPYPCDTVDQALQTLRRAGAVPVLAHPDQYPELCNDEPLKHMISLGLEGVEAEYRDYEQTSKNEFRTQAERWGLLQTGGGDFHQSVHQMHPISRKNAEKFLDRLANGRRLIPPTQRVNNPECTRRIDAVSRWLAELKDCPGLYGVGVMGSVGSGFADASSDIEVLIIHDDESTDVAKTLQEHGATVKQPFGSDRIWYSFTANGFDISALLQPYRSLVENFEPPKDGSRDRPRSTWLRFDLRHAHWLDSLTPRRGKIRSLLALADFSSQERSRILQSYAERARSGDWQHMLTNALDRGNHAWQTWIRYELSHQTIKACYALNWSILPDGQLKWFEQHASWMMVLPQEIRTLVRELGTAAESELGSVMNRILGNMVSTIAPPMPPEMNSEADTKHTSKA